jgi:S1-C subfamily serine protease
LSIGVFAAVFAVSGPQVAAADDPTQAVFLLQVVDRADGGFQSTLYGTAFFISSDGTALTNSHVVSLAARDPARYALLAVVNREFYSASIACASQLGHDRMAPERHVRPSRDVAKIRLSPSTFPFAQWQLALSGGERLVNVRAHRAALPPFPSLTVAGRPSSGAPVRVIGFGHLPPAPQRSTTDGQVLGIDQTSDGTEIFGIDLRGPALPGNSGSPVLNPEDEVIGMWTWHSLSAANMAMAISNSAFLVPCR